MARPSSMQGVITYSISTHFIYLTLITEKLTTAKKLVIPEQLRPTNCTRPSGVWALVLQVITPCAEEDLAIQY